MKPKSIILVIAIIAASSVTTICIIRFSEHKREAAAQRDLHTATTNFMQTFKPDTSPPIFPEK